MAETSFLYSLIAIPFLLTVATACLARYARYRSALRKFELGHLVETIYKIKKDYVVSPLRRSKRYAVSEAIEDVFYRNKMFFAKRDNDYCCFTRFFTTVPCKLFITSFDRDDTSFEVAFTFYDCCAGKVMLSHRRHRFEKRMEELFLEFEAGLQRFIMSEGD